MAPPAIGWRSQHVRKYMILNFRLGPLLGSEHRDSKIFNVFEKKVVRLEALS